MNKVVSIEIARQVFWIDEKAYAVLNSYLQKIRQQLINDECADDIYDDIELRIAELLFDLNSSEEKAITEDLLEAVIAQVGFIDSDSKDEDLPRKSYLDPQNKILAGVCAGLAIRLGVPAFILRVIFLALAAFFGLGIVLYLIFMVSLDTNTSRNSALASQGKAQTARQIANYEAPKVNKLIQLQRIIFLPISFVGALLSVFGAHFKNRRKGYISLFKNLFAISMFGIAVVLSIMLLEFNSVKVFSRSISWLLSAAVMYLIVLGLVVYIREYYLAKPNLKVDKKLKVGAIVPIAFIFGAVIYLNYTQSAYHSQLVEKTFKLSNNQLALQFEVQKDRGDYARNVYYHVRPIDSDGNQVKLRINYSAYGENSENAVENIQSVEYFYTFENDTLLLSDHWTLKQDALNRSQHVEVTIEVPQNIQLTSSWPLSVNKDDFDAGVYRYSTSQFGSTEYTAKLTQYLSSQQYFHELGGDFRNQLSDNEREVLEDKFCEAFFISDAWNCRSNILNPTKNNIRFDRAFQNDSENIDQLREFLLPDRSLFVSHLAEMNELIAALSIGYPIKSDFQEYIEHLLSIKSPPLPEINPEPG